METTQHPSYSDCRIEADMLLVHAPAYFDFRTESRVYFPYLSTSGDVPITPLYEYYPMGFNTLRRYLRERGFSVDIINLCSLLIKYPALDIERLLRQLETKVIGIDLHWMVHVQGSLEVAKLLKKIHPGTKIVFGGISSSYYAQELIRYPFIDIVVRGYDTHLPMELLMRAILNGGDLSTIPNLVWKDNNGEIQMNALDHTPTTFSLGMDWSHISAPSKGELFPISELLSAQTTGCTNHCGWCGGSRESFKQIYGTAHSVARKDLNEVTYEFETMKTLPHLNTFHYYACSSYNEPASRLEYLLRLVKESDLKSVSFEQFHLTEDHMLKKMARSSDKAVITLSPESHDLEISRRAGRGTYSMEEMELWIEKALDYGIYEINIWFFIGMPQQDRKSVFDTLRYCETLLEKFKDRNVVPFFCPMAPYLDPGSTFFSEPKKHGYRLYAQTLDEHRRSAESASFINRMNYETEWMSREEIVYSGYDAIRELYLMKDAAGMLPKSMTRPAVKKIDDAKEFLRIVHHIDSLEDKREREKELTLISGEIRKRNEAIFYSGVSNQAFPVNRRIGDRWFDAIPWDKPTLEELNNRE